MLCVSGGFSRTPVESSRQSAPPRGLRSWSQSTGARGVLRSGVLVTLGRAWKGDSKITFYPDGIRELDLSATVTLTSGPFRPVLSVEVSDPLHRRRCARPTHPTCRSNAGGARRCLPDADLGLLEIAAFVGEHAPAVAPHPAVAGNVCHSFHLKVIIWRIDQSDRGTEPDGGWKQALRRPGFVNPSIIQILPKPAARPNLS
jgi:hypothetical protein